MSFPDEASGSAGERVDAFQNGAFYLIQPDGSGFRAGLDALLLAAFVARGDVGETADLGAGTGAVGFSAVLRAPGIAVRFVERDPVVAERLTRSIALPQNAALAPRLLLSTVDLLAGRAAREAAGLGDGQFDRVLTNPPFHPFGHRGSPDAGRRAAMSEAGADALVAWIAVSAALLRHGGTFLAVMRPESLSALLEAAPDRLGAIGILPVHTRPGEPAKRLIVSARRGSRAPLRILPALWLCEPDGRPSAAAAGVSDGSFEGAPLID